jgi:hypothetical protein
MKKSLVAGAVAAALCLYPQLGDAAVQTLQRAGAWEAFGGTSNNGTPVCGMSSSGTGKYFGIKFFAGAQTLTIQLGSSEWRIKNGAKQRVIMRFDTESPWNATATGMHFNDGDAGLEFDINRNQLDQFMREYRNSGQIVVSFPDSDVTSWQGSLAGTDRVSDAFVRCIRAL